MNLGAIFIGLALLVLVVPFIIDPIRKRHGRGFSGTLLKSTDTGEVSENALFALRDLEFDYQTEKITEEDYQKIHAELLTQAAEVIETKQQEGARIEELIQARRRDKTIEANCPQCDRTLHDEDQFCPGCGHARGILCPGCGRRNRSEDNYCTKCGHNLKQQTIQSQ